MAGVTGSHSLADLQGATAVGQIDDEAVAATLNAEMDATNRVVQDQLRNLAEYTTERESTYGTGATGTMHRGDDFARAQTQKGYSTGQVAFPFEKWIYATGWTNDFRRKASPAKYAAAFVGARAAYLAAFQTGIREALFRSANVTFVDYMDSKLSLGVKRLLNADSSAVPYGPNGETFVAASHTHYSAIATLTVATARALYTNVVEHGFGRDLRIYINSTDVATWQALTGFVSASVPGVIVASTTARTVEELDITVVNNRFVGRFEGVPVYTKPWVYAGYAVALDLGADEKPLAVREDIAGSSRLTVEGIINLNPLTAQYFVARFGVGVRNRAAAAVLYFGTSGTYADPL